MQIENMNQQLQLAEMNITRISMEKNKLESELNSTNHTQNNQSTLKVKYFCIIIK